MAAEDKADETLFIEEQFASGKIPVTAPAGGFTEHARRRTSTPERAWAAAAIISMASF